MKKRIISKMFAVTMTMTLIFASALTVHASEDGAARDEGVGYGDAGGSGECGFDNPSDSGSSDSSSDSGSSESYSEPSESYSGGGNDSYDGASYDAGQLYTESGSSGTNSSAGGGVASTGLSRSGNTASVPGKETFRKICKPADGTLKIFHCGIEQYTAQLKDADGNAVAYKSAGLYNVEGTTTWYLNIVTADGVDTTGYNIETAKGSVTYLPKLGMSGVMLNGVLVVNAEETVAE